MDIDGWLRGIGLEQYAQTFRDNAIDADVLCDLTDGHLRELGLPLGARLKLLRAVAALRTGQTLVSPEITTHAARTDAERRQVTVMFTDLVGSTALSACHLHRSHRRRSCRGNLEGRFVEIWRGRRMARRIL